VELVGGGVLAGTLVSPRSAVEYGVPTNGASAAEAPESLDMAPGDLAEPDVLGRLEKGIWIGNVWYLNYSDRAACRTTGMTRFATFWVENGEIAQPLNVMRFDETIYRVLGGNLLSLTREREMIVEAATYFARQLGSAHVPGALVEDFRLTL
jgi:predicted Zn-dependent protease